jgi:hypothetical protein
MQMPLIPTIEENLLVIYLILSSNMSKDGSDLPIRRCGAGLPIP